MAGTITGAVIVVVLGSNILQRRNLRRALWLTLRGRSILAAIFSTLPLDLLAIAPLIGMGALKWLCYWVVLWAPLYILAFLRLTFSL
ncbi:hypothetical protein C8R44DRAFT_786911, partial [Mycena epipterygia]